jgi:hypothetical protein
MYVFRCDTGSQSGPKHAWKVLPSVTMTCTLVITGSFVHIVPVVLDVSRFLSVRILLQVSGTDA